jgi:hypothetical protein
MSNKDKLTFSQGTGDVLVASDKPHLRRLDHQCWSLGQLSALGEEGETLINMRATLVAVGGGHLTRWLFARICCRRSRHCRRRGIRRAKRGSFDDEAGSEEKYRRSRLEKRHFGRCVSRERTGSCPRWDRIAVSFRLSACLCGALRLHAIMIKNQNKNKN